MDIFVVGEDDACKAVIYRVIAFCAALRKTSLKVVSELPARGGEIKNKIKNFNLLSKHTPVVLLTDLDNNTCPPSFIGTLMHGENKNRDFVFSVAVDEVEAWLLADREGFARYFQVDIDRIPGASKTKMQGRSEKTEIVCPYKASLYFAQQILPHSRSKTKIEQLTPRPGATKGPEYNSVMIPFIQDHWNLETAMDNSNSLSGMVDRVCRLIDNQKPAE